MANGARVVLVIGMPDGDWEVPLSVVQADWEACRANHETEEADDGAPPGTNCSTMWAEFVHDWDAVEAYVRECMSWKDVKEHAVLRPNTAQVPEYEQEWADACFIVQRLHAVGEEGRARSGA